MHTDPVPEHYGVAEDEQFTVAQRHGKVVFIAVEVVSVHAGALHTPLVVLHINPVDAVHKFFAEPTHKHCAALEPLTHGEEQTPEGPQYCGAPAVAIHPLAFAPEPHTQLAV